MNDCKEKTVSFVAILGAFLVVAALVYAMKQYTKPPALNQARVDERKKALAEVSAADAEGLATYGWVDPAKGITRLKIERAIELTLAEYKAPAAARSNLLSRATKAATALPPPNYE